MSHAIIRVILPTAVLAAGVAAWFGLHAAKPEPDKTTHAARPISVHATPVRRDDITLEVSTQGEVRGRTELDLVTQVGGRIVSVSPEFTEGGRIEPGVSLLQIEDTDYRLALHEASARVAEAQVKLEQAIADADVARKQLRNETNASPLALKKPQVAEARARLEAARANLEQAKLNLKRTNIALPFAGRLASTQADTGQYVSPGTVVGRAFATDIVEVRLPFTDSQLASLGLPIGFTAKPGQGPSVHFSARVAGQLQHWQGQLTRLDAAIDPDTRLLYGMAEVRDPYGVNASENAMPLAVGLFVEAVITGRKLTDAYLVPADALRAGDTVYLVNEQGKLETRQVEVAHRSGTRAVVSNGLRSGEQVVTSAIRNPVPGMALVTIDGDEQGVAAN